MQDKLDLKVGENVHMFTKSGGHINVVVMTVNGDKAVCFFPSEGKGPGAVFLCWDGKDQIYRSQPTGHEIRLERPVIVGAKLVKTQTDDGITTMSAAIGKRYTLDLMSVEDRSWGNVNRPREFRTRKSAVFTSEGGGEPGVIPLELFEIEAN